MQFKKLPEYGKNAKRVLGIIRMKGECTRNNIRELTDLSWASVSNIVDEIKDMLCTRKTGTV